MKIWDIDKVGVLLTRNYKQVIKVILPNKNRSFHYSTTQVVPHLLRSKATIESTILLSPIIVENFDELNLTNV